jgi:hypothetical protein
MLRDERQFDGGLSEEQVRPLFLEMKYMPDDAIVKLVRRAENRTQLARLTLRRVFRFLEHDWQACYDIDVVLKGLLRFGWHVGAPGVLFARLISFFSTYSSH